MESVLEQAPTVPAEPPQTRSRRVMRGFAWAGIFLVLLAFFTIVKLPEGKLVNLIQGHLAYQLGRQGITLRPEKASFSVFMGLKFKMKKVRVYLPPPAKETLIDEIQVSPSFTSLLLGRAGAVLYIRQGKGDLSATVARRGARVYLDFAADDLDLAKLEVIGALAGFKFGATIDGKGSFSGEPNLPLTYNGSLSLRLNKVLIENQNLVFGGAFPFPIPQIAMSESQLDVSADKGKIKIKTFKLGRPDKSTDDLVTSMTGEVTLAQNPMETVLNLQIPQLKASETVRRKLLLDIAAAKYKQPDGTYSGITISGPVTSLIPGGH